MFRPHYFLYFAKSCRSTLTSSSCTEMEDGNKQGSKVFCLDCRCRCGNHLMSCQCGQNACKWEAAVWFKHTHSIHTYTYTHGSTDSTTDLFQLWLVSFRDHMASRSASLMCHRASHRVVICVRSHCCDTHRHTCCTCDPHFLLAPVFHPLQTCLSSMFVWHLYLSVVCVRNKLLMYLVCIVVALIEGFKHLCCCSMKIYQILVPHKCLRYEQLKFIP